MRNLIYGLVCVLLILLGCCDFRFETDDIDGVTKYEVIYVEDEYGVKTMRSNHEEIYCLDTDEILTIISHLQNKDNISCDFKHQANKHVMNVKCNNSMVLRFYFHNDDLGLYYDFYDINSTNSKLVVENKGLILQSYESDIFKFEIELNLIFKTHKDNKHIFIKIPAIVNGSFNLKDDDVNVNVII